MDDNIRFLFIHISIGCWILLHLAWNTWCAVDCDDENICQCNAGTSGNLIVDCSRKSLLKMPTGIPISAYDVKINSNKIAVLPEGLFANTVNLIEINLNHNLITEIPDGMFSIMPKLNWLYFDGNPLDCGCLVKIFRTWLLSVQQSSMIVDAYCENGAQVVDLPEASFNVCVEATMTSATLENTPHVEMKTSEQPQETDIIRTYSVNSTETQHIETQSETLKMSTSHLVTQKKEYSTISQEAKITSASLENTQHGEMKTQEQHQETASIRTYSVNSTETQHIETQSENLKTSKSDLETQKKEYSTISTISQEASMTSAALDNTQHGEMKTPEQHQETASIRTYSVNSTETQHIETQSDTSKTPTSDLVTHKKEYSTISTISQEATMTSATLENTSHVEMKTSEQHQETDIIRTYSVNSTETQHIETQSETSKMSTGDLVTHKKEDSEISTISQEASMTSAALDNTQHGEMKTPEQHQETASIRTYSVNSTETQHIETQSDTSKTPTSDLVTHKKEYSTISTISQEATMTSATLENTSHVEMKTPEQHQETGIIRTYSVHSTETQHIETQSETSKMSTGDLVTQKKEYSSISEETTVIFDKPENTTLPADSDDPIYETVLKVVSGGVAATTIITVLTKLKGYLNSVRQVSQGNDSGAAEVDNFVNDGIEFISFSDAVISNEDIFRNIPPLFHQNMKIIVDSHERFGTDTIV